MGAPEVTTDQAADGQDLDMGVESGNRPRLFDSSSSPKESSSDAHSSHVRSLTKKG